MAQAEIEDGADFLMPGRGEWLGGRLDGRCDNCILADLEHVATSMSRPNPVQAPGRRRSRAVPQSFEAYPGQRCFTLLELLVVIAVIVILAGLLLPTLGKAKSKAQGAQCLSNLRQHILVLQMYAGDNREQLPFSHTCVIPQPDDKFAWVQGWMDWLDPGKPDNWDSSLHVAKSPVMRYLGNSLAVWKCPADTSTGLRNGQDVPRVRSYSMDPWVGGPVNCPTRELWDPWVLYRRLSDMVNPGPARTFVFLDERRESIDDACFLLNQFVTWYDAPNNRIVDWPAFYHGGAASLAFGDGHCESRKWKDPRTTPKDIGSHRVPDCLVGVPSPYNPDVTWLQERSTRRR